MKNNVSIELKAVNVNQHDRPTFTDVYDEKYLLLTTFTKDGRPKPTTGLGRARGRQAADHHRRRILEDQADQATPRG